jgi:cytochrome c-type biogenesis protein CcmE
MGPAVKIVVSAALILGSGGYLLAESLKDPDTLTYFHGADVVIAQPDQFKQQRIRMGGHVAKGSIMQKPGTLEYQFEVEPVAAMAKFPEALGKTVTVRYTGVVPDTFKDDAEVIVAGKLAPNGAVFEANELVAKCPSKYEAAEKNSKTY